MTSDSRTVRVHETYFFFLFMQIHRPSCSTPDHIIHMITIASIFLICMSLRVEASRTYFILAYDDHIIHEGDILETLTTEACTSLILVPVQSMKPCTLQTGLVLLL
jgi:hypothetical protein